jgi:5-methylcytosine-specific restriction protein A
LDDFGDKGFKNALKAIKRYIDEYKQNESNIKSIKNIHKEYSRIINDKSLKNLKNEILMENTITRALVTRHERNKKARKKCIEHYGCSCNVCGKSLSEIYGDVAKDYIHIHHIREISLIKEKYEIDPVKDLRPLCPNCHSIVHLKSPPYELDEVKRMLIK